MNVLFMTIAYPQYGESNIYSDLMQEFQAKGHAVFVLCSCERRYKQSTKIFSENGIKVLRIKTGNLTKTNLIEKGLASLFLEHQYIQAIREYFSDISFDLLLYSTPPITLVRPIQFLKTRDCCICYLLLKDIFPQNAVDLGYLNPKGLVYRYFKNKEKTLYQTSDFIGCMSPANVRYILTHNTELTAEKVEVCPNAISPRQLKWSQEERNQLFEIYGVPNEAVVFLYGGNLGKPQGLDFLLEILVHFQGRADVFFLIVGSGTEYNKIDMELSTKKYKNVKLISYMLKKDYDIILANADVGMIFLDPRFTIPNFPSRLTAYMEASLPVIAATDTVSDIKECLIDSGCGIWMINGDYQGFISAVNKMTANPEIRREMGKLGRKYLEENFNVSQNVELIMNHMVRHD